MTNKNDALPVVAVLDAPSLRSDSHPKFGDGIRVVYESDYLREVATRDAELAELRQNNDLLHDAGQRVDDHYQAIIGQLQAELAALRAKSAIQVDYVAVMRDNGDGGLKPEWLMEGDTAEMMAGMYLCCLDGGSLLFEEGSGQVYAAPLVSDKAGASPELTVWYGRMPESNGKSNWTAILHRKGDGLMDGPHITIERSEYPDRVRYEADRVRHIIGERESEPDILLYDAEAHSGYVDAALNPLAADVVQVPRDDSKVIAVARKWFYETFEDDLLQKMQDHKLIAQAEGFSVSMIATLEQDLHDALLATRQEGSKV